MEIHESDILDVDHVVDPAHPDAEPVPRRSKGMARVLQSLGPGLITGASDDDPSGIATYTMAGASLGLATLWTAPLTFPLMFGVQFICAKVGMVSGMGLASVLRRHYSRKVLVTAVFALLVANTINAGADIGAIAAAINLFVPVPVYMLVIPVVCLILALQIWGSYRFIVNTFKWLSLALFAYIGAAVLARPDWLEVAKATFLPPARLDRAYMLTLVAILGTTISPYLFFWQASQEVEEEVSMGRYCLWQRQGATVEELHDAMWDTGVGMLFCNLVFYFVIVSAAATLHRAGMTDIQTAAQAAQALEPLAGKAAKILFAIGLVGAGLLAVPVLTATSAFAVTEAMGWRHGLNERPGRAPAFYAIIVTSTAAGLAMNFLGINPLKALFGTAVINGLLAPPLLVLLMQVANNKKVMGEHVNGTFLNIVGWLAVAVMSLAAIGLFFSA